MDWCRKMGKTSVIIPVYNVEEYLNQCVDSVLRQTYNNIEVILVDDGSTDQSGKICDDYAKIDSRVSVIHKPNGGLSDARNVGTQHACGEYIFYLDSDDWIEDETLEILRQLLNSNHADIAIANYFYAYDDHSDSAAFLEQDIIMDKMSAMKSLLENKTVKNFAWGKLYRRQLLTCLSFPVEKLFEDTYWTHLVFDRADCVVLSRKEMIHYRQRSGSISYQFDIRRVNLIEGNMERRIFVKQNYPELLACVDENLLKLILGVYVESVKNYEIKRHKTIKRYLLETANKLNEDGVLDENVDCNLKKDYKVFCRHPYMYMGIKLLNRVRKV